MKRYLMMLAATLFACGAPATDGAAIKYDEPQALWFEDGHTEEPEDTDEQAAGTVDDDTAGDVGALREGITVSGRYGSEQATHIAECGALGGTTCLAQAFRGTITYKDDQILAHGCAGSLWEQGAVFGANALDTQLKNSANGWRLQLNPVQPNDGANINIICCTNKTCAFKSPVIGLSCPIGTFGCGNGDGLTRKTLNGKTYIEALNWQVAVNGDFVVSICQSNHYTTAQCQQFIRNTFAHELGHTLGLGHDIIGTGRTLLSEGVDPTGPVFTTQMLFTSSEMQQLGGFLP